MDKAKGDSLFERCLRVHMEVADPEPPPHPHPALVGAIEMLKWILLVVLLMLAAFYFAR